MRCPYFNECKFAEEFSDICNGQNNNYIECETYRRKIAKNKK